MQIDYTSFIVKLGGLALSKPEKEAITKILNESKINGSVPAETVVGQVSVSSANGETAGQFEKAYNHAMTVLTQYILTTEEKRAKFESDGNEKGEEHYRWKVHFMRTAKTTIKENIKMYLEHPELFNK